MPSAYLQWRFHSGERVVVRGPLVRLLLDPGFKLCVNLDSGEIFCVRENQDAERF